MYTQSMDTLSAEDKRDSRIAAREAAAIPLPREDTTPPVMKIYLIMGCNDTAKQHAPQNGVSAVGWASAFIAHRFIPRYSAWA